uniref:Uncharacterized protein n=1 Tax=Mandrillus leucophaeus TaxID=9568 RepID=A0A2K6AJG4_MANLE
MRIFTFIFTCKFSSSPIYYLLLWVKTNLGVSAVLALRAAGLNRNYPRVSKNVIKFKTTAPSPALDSSRPQMFTVSKCFLCEALAWKHLNPIALYKSYAQIHCRPSNSQRKQLTPVVLGSSQDCGLVRPSTGDSLITPWALEYAAASAKNTLFSHHPSFPGSLLPPPLGSIP